MPTICVVFHSITGTTSALAESVVEGIASVEGCAARPLAIEGGGILKGRFSNASLLEEVDAADAIVFGAPTFMGGPSAQFKAFADASSDRWESQRWEGKLAAGFTVGSSASGDQLATIQFFSILAAQHGMLWVGLDIPGQDAQGRNRLGAQMGLIAQTPGTLLPDSDLVTAKYLGARVAGKTLLLSRERNPRGSAPRGGAPLDR